MIIHDHKLYTRWQGIMNRCYNPNHKAYKNYGARGIYVCKQWHDFKKFVYDIDNIVPHGKLLYLKGYQLDKDLKNGNCYSPENCTVLTTKENSLLSIKMQKILAYNMEETHEYYSIAEASRQLKVPISSIKSAIKRGNLHKKSGYYFKSIS